MLYIIHYKEKGRKVTKTSNKIQIFILQISERVWHIVYELHQECVLTSTPIKGTGRTSANQAK